MFLLPLFLLAITVASHPTFPLTKIKQSGPRPSLSRRAEYVDVNATQVDFEGYTVVIGLGCPPTYYTVILDTGSSNTWIGAEKGYVPTDTSVDTGLSFNVTYGSGAVSGGLVLELVTLAPGLVVNNQTIGIARNDTGFAGFDGIIGLGPTDLTLRTVSSDPNQTIPTVIDSALAQGLIDTDEIGVSFAPATSNVSTNGVLTFGGANNDLFIGSITRHPRTLTPPSSRFFGVNVTATYGNTTIIGNSTAGIVDTGTTLVLLTNNTFANYQAAIAGSFFNDSIGVLFIPKSTALQNFTFVIDDTPYTLDPTAQVFPDQADIPLGVDPVPGFSVGTITQSNLLRPGLELVLGQKFMEKYYALFDNTSVGFASTNNTFSGVAV